MNIRSKIILITLPLIITPLILTLIISVLSARNGITLVATELLTFKTEVLTNYMESQWNLLTSNDLESSEEYIDISKIAVQSYSKTLIKNSSERIFAVDSSGELRMSTAGLDLTEEDKNTLREMIGREVTGWQDLAVGGIDLIAETSFFEPFGWYVLVTVERDTFYGTLSRILIRTGLICAGSLVLALILLMMFSRYLTKPLENVVEVIRSIITTNDLSRKVELQYNDETGKLGHYFNIMTGELDKAYDQMKRYALQAVVAKHKEAKIRNIFQKYVPKDVIERFFENPESMLVGENRILTVLFSDIRGFTTISEGLNPEDLVDSLNKYFETMVDVITEHRGIVDKYIGDAIMAFFGAPVSHPNDPVQAVLAGLNMIEQLDHFNIWQRERNREEFKIGIGLNRGVVTIGNIGSEKKMDYTVIGDMVNLASRLEGLTKLYKEPLLISESLHAKVSGVLPCRMIDRVIVKGKTMGVRVFSVKKELTPAMKEAWDLHEAGIDNYYKRDFTRALDHFKNAQQLLPEDQCLALFIGKCEKYISTPPDANWSGDTVLNRK